MADGATAKDRSRGWQGTMLKLMGADDYEFTVTSAPELITDHYARLTFTGGGLLRDRQLHPTMWLRLWFEKDGKPHQRGYTLVDADVENDTFAMEFALHGQTADGWALSARPGDTIVGTFMGSKFAIPDPAPTGWLIVGDASSLPAINSLLDAASSSSAPAAPATIWYEYSHDDEKALPLRLRAQDTVHYVPRQKGGAALIEAVKGAAFDASGQFGWVATEATLTRKVGGIFRKDFTLGRKGVKSQAYWMEGSILGQFGRTS